MDIFHEQLVKIKSTSLVTVSRVLIWLAAVLVAAACFMLAFSVTPLLIFVGAAAVYGAYKLSGMLNIEFEYIVTNGTVDIDKIINKTDRKRIVSFDCRAIESIANFDGNKPSDIKTYVCTDEKGIVVTVNADNCKKCAVAFSPDKSLFEAMKPFISRAVLKEFGDS